MRVVTYRGHCYRGGLHDFKIGTGGVEFFPRLVASEHRSQAPRQSVSSGKPALDALLGGGYLKGSSTLILGPAGCGKSTLCLQFVTAAIAHGGRAALFLFDEEINLLMARARQLGFNLAAMRDAGMLLIEQVDAAELSPGEFAHRVRTAVTAHGVDTVVIDSLNGYQAAMPDERLLHLHMHEVLLYLNRQGVSTFLTIAQHGVVDHMETSLAITYLADTVILLRYFEFAGRVRRAISVVKKRAGTHEDGIREFRIDKKGIEVGAPVAAWQGVQGGSPIFAGNPDPLDRNDRS
jgi:circadian clock protein KaiC